MNLLTKLIQSRTRQIKAMQRHQKPSEVKPVGQTTHVRIELPPSPPPPISAEECWQRVREGFSVSLTRERPGLFTMMHLQPLPARNMLRITRRLQRGVARWDNTGVFRDLHTPDETVRLVRLPRNQGELERTIESAW